LRTSRIDGYIEQEKAIRNETKKGKGRKAKETKTKNSIGWGRISPSNPTVRSHL